MNTPGGHLAQCVTVNVSVLSPKRWAAGRTGKGAAVSYSRLGVAHIVRTICTTCLTGTRFAFLTKPALVDAKMATVVATHCAGRSSNRAYYLHIFSFSKIKG